MTNPSRVAFSVFGRDIYWYGIIIAAGALVALLVAMKLAKRRGWMADDVMDFCLFAIPSGVIGARLYYVLFQWDMYRDDLLRIVRIWEGGLAIYGGIIGGFICGLIFCRIKKRGILDLADIVAPGLVLAQGIGRWGNFFNQEAYGATVVNRSHMWFPMAVRIDATDTVHYAVFFYEFVWCVLIFMFLLLCYKRFKHKGDVFLWYALLYAFERMFVESLRTDSLYAGDIRISQLLSVVVFASLAAFMVVRALRERGQKPAPAGDADAEVPLADTDAADAPMADASAAAVGEDAASEKESEPAEQDKQEDATGEEV